MSSRHWNCYRDRQGLEILHGTSLLLYSCMDIDSDVSSDTLSESDDDSVVLPTVMTVGTIGQFCEVHKVYTDDTIQFGQMKTLVDFNDTQSLLYFRFKKDDILILINAVWPRLRGYLQGQYDRLRVKNDYRCHFETALLIMLYRFLRPSRFRPEMEAFFGMRRAHLSASLFTITEAFENLASKYLNNPSIFLNRIPYYAQRIEHKVELVDRVWGFIDGTLRKTCRPTYYQKHAYSGHKRCHGLKFQSVTTPDGLIACLWGPMNGNRHDSHMLRESNLLAQLRDMMTDIEPVYSLYGDPAYPQSMYIFGGYNNPAAGSPEADWNTRMSKVREAVEWGFKEIVNRWRFLDFRASMKLFELPVARYYTIGAFLCNIRSIFYENTTSAFFECDTLSLEEYLRLID